MEGEEKGLGGSGDSTDSNGVFCIDNLAPGRYCVSVYHGSDYYCEPFFFEVTDQDLTGLELRLHRGAVVTGRAVIEEFSGPKYYRNCRISSSLPAIKLQIRVIP